MRIAIYHLSIKIISRGKGRSAVAAAAYRAGAKIANDYDGLTHDYTRKGGIAHTEILLPENAPPEYTDRAILWNAVEKTEKAKNAQLAREIELALPVELSLEQNTELVRAYCQEHFVNTGMCADICIHDKADGNPHAHVMLTMRPFHEDGTWGGKQKKEYILDANGDKIYDSAKRQYKCKSIPAMDWNDWTKAEIWRAGWAEAVNAALEQQGVAGRVDHRSYERQGIEQIPTIHLGPAAFQMEKRGIRTERGDINRQVQLDNQMLRHLRARIRKMEHKIHEITAAATLSLPIPSINLMEVLTGILDHPEQKSRYRKVADLKTFAKAIGFLEANGINNLPGLRLKVGEMRTHLDEQSGALKKNERRKKTLDEHIRNAQTHQETKDTYHRYKELPPKRQTSFYEQHRAEIVLYESAKHYLDDVLQGRGTIPIRQWKREAAELDVDRATMYAGYTQLRDEVQNAESILRCVERVVREEEQVQIRQEKTTER